MDSKTRSLLTIAGLSVWLASCGGGSSTTATNTGGGGTTTLASGPAISALIPAYANAGGPGISLTIHGSNFGTGSGPTDGGARVMFDGVMMQTNLISSTELEADIPPSMIPTAGTLNVSVLYTTQIPNRTSNSLTFTVLPALKQALVAPQITSFSPSSVLSGSKDFTLSVLGTGFIGVSTLWWDDTPIPTIYVSSTKLEAHIPASMAAKISSPIIQVVDETDVAGPGGSNQMPFPIGFSPQVVEQAATDLVWDPVHKLIYLSVPSTATANASSIIALDPSTGKIVSSTPVAGGVDKLAISSDSGFLYAGLDTTGAVQRFILPAMTADIQISLGTSPLTHDVLCPLALAAAPVSPNTVAVSLGDGNNCTNARDGIVIYDDSTARPTAAPGPDSTPSAGNFYDSLVWGSDDTALYALNNEGSGGNVYILAVDSNGVSQTNEYGNVGSFFDEIHYQAGTQRIYTDNGGILDPATGATAAFPQLGQTVPFYGMTPDADLDRAYFLDQTPQQSVLNGPLSLETFDLRAHTPVNLVSLPPSIVFDTTFPMKTIRWGSDGVAFITPTQIVIVEGQLVTQ